MQEVLSVRIIATIGLALLAAAAPSAAHADDAEAIRQVFSTYKDAIISGDAEIVASATSQGTIDYFAEMQRSALCSSPEETKEQPLVNRMLIVYYRHNVPHATLLEMSGREPFVYAAGHGWIVKESVEDVQLGSVKVRKKTRASAAQLRYGEPAGRIAFVKDPEGWRVDLARTMKATSRPMKLTAKRLEVPEEELVFGMNESLSGTRPSDQVWEPIAPNAPVCTGGDEPADAG
jgi:hypothetical protein